jgi:hypothetical protein
MLTKGRDELQGLTTNSWREGKQLPTNLAESIESILLDKNGMGFELD